jgi:hypothetical protein
MLTPTDNSRLEDLGRQQQRNLDEFSLRQMLTIVRVEINCRLKDKVDSIHFEEDPLFNFRDGFRFLVRKGGKCFVSPIIDFYSNDITADVKKVKRGKLEEFLFGEEYVYDCSRYIKNIINIHCDEVERVIKKYNL